MKFSPPGFCPISLDHPSLFTFQNHPTLLEVSPRPSLWAHLQSLGSLIHAMVSMTPRCWWLTRGIFPAHTSQTSCFRWFKGFSSTARLRLNSWCLPWSLVLPHYILSQGMVPPSTTQNWEPRTYPQYFPLNAHIQTTTSHSFYPLDLSNLPTSLHVYYIHPSLNNCHLSPGLLHESPDWSHWIYSWPFQTDDPHYATREISLKWEIWLCRPPASVTTHSFRNIKSLPVANQTLHVLTPFCLSWSPHMLVPLSLCTPTHWPLAS